MTKNTWITSDNHYFHKNISKYCPESRPFSSVSEMTEVLIERHNSLVKPTDDWYCLGDFSFGNYEQTKSILERLNGRKYYIFGNHDKVMKNNDIYKHFVWMKDYAEIKLNKKQICLFHFPISEWHRSHYGSYHFYGHLHSKCERGRSKDIGCDSNNLYPYNVEELLDRLKPDFTQFHHEQREGER